MSIQRKPLIYLAAPLSKGDVLTNVSRAMIFWHHLMKRGDIACICPHWSAFQHMHNPDMSWNGWLEYDEQLILRCDGLIRFPGESPGADREVAFAIEHGIPAHRWNDAGFQEWIDSLCAAQ